MPEKTNKYTDKKEKEKEEEKKRKKKRKKKKKEKEKEEKSLGNVIKLGSLRLLVDNVFHLHNKKEFMLPKVSLLVSNWKPGLNFFQSALH